MDTDVTTSEPEPTVDREHVSAGAIIGRRIRSIRRAHSLTLVQLAERSGLSQPFLSQVETGRAQPSFASVDRIARALGTTQIELFAALSGSSLSPNASEQSGFERTLGPSGPYAEGSVRVMALASRSLSPMEFSATNVEFGDYFNHDEEEFVYVIAGAIEVDIASQTFRRGSGESFFLRSRTPHRWRTATGDGYRVLSVKEKVEFTPKLADS